MHAPLRQDTGMIPHLLLLVRTSCCKSVSNTQYVPLARDSFSNRCQMSNATLFPPLIFSAVVKNIADVSPCSTHCARHRICAPLSGCKHALAVAVERSPCSVPRMSLCSDHIRGTAEAGRACSHFVSSFPFFSLHSALSNSLISLA